MWWRDKLQRTQKGKSPSAWTPKGLAKNFAAGAANQHHHPGGQ
jgi:hypothetical protein